MQEEDLHEEDINEEDMHEEDMQEPDNIQEEVEGEERTKTHDEEGEEDGEDETHDKEGEDEIVEENDPLSFQQPSRKGCLTKLGKRYISKLGMKLFRCYFCM